MALILEEGAGVWFAMPIKRATQKKPRNKKDALFGLKDFMREPEP